MKDTLIYCSDLAALKEQLTTDRYFDEEGGRFIVNQTLVPIRYKDNTSLSYVRGFSLDLSVYTMLEDLGDYDVMFADVNAEAKYRSVYDYTQMQSYTNEDGNVVEHTLPKEIGRFA